VAPHNERGEIIHSSPPVPAQNNPSSTLAHSSTSFPWWVLILVMCGGICFFVAILPALLRMEVRQNSSTYQSEGSSNQTEYSDQTNNSFNNDFESPTPALRPTKTPIKTITSKPSTCPGAPQQRLILNEDAEVCTKSDVVYLRTGPGRKYNIIESVTTGTTIWVIDGPECSDNWSWWKIELSDGTQGWMSEGGDSIDAYFLCPN